MRTFVAAALSAAALALTACGGDGDDALGQKAEDRAEAQAENLEAAADNSSGPAAEQLEAQADSLERQGDRREEAIDNSDVDTDEMTDAQQNAMVDR